MGVLILKLANPNPGALHKIHMPQTESSEPFRWRSLPEAIEPKPSVTMRSFTGLHWWPVWTVLKGETLRIECGKEILGRYRI
jgi:hypothetical protein